MPTPDLDAYFARLGYHGPRDASMTTLRALHLAHIQSVPFENLDVLLGRRISLEPADIERKIVGERRGGYCFEQNTLFAGVLRALGFTVTAFLARVRRNAPPEVRTPLTHMILRVSVDDRLWLADVGFGSAGTTAPLALDTTAPQPTPLEPHRLLGNDRRRMHQALLGNDWTDLYEFVLEEPAPADFEVGNWYSCTHPRAHFTNNLVVTRLDGERRLVIVNREFTIRQPDGSAETRPIASPDDLLDLLARHFGLALPAGTRLDIPAAPWGA